MMSAINTSNGFDGSTNHGRFDRLDEKCLQINRYNEKYGTKYSYGKFHGQVLLGKIIWCGGEFVPVEII